MATIRITNLKVSTLIGIQDWERIQKQDVIINITLEFDAQKSSHSDSIGDTLDYKAVTKDIIQEVEGSSCFLLERLTKIILDKVMGYPLVQSATVKVDKPLALRYTDSVSIEMTASR